MIKSFAHKGLELFHRTGKTKGIQAIHAKRLHQILTMLEAAKTVEDMGAPGLHLHPLKDAHKGIWSVTVQANWRITFRFEAGDAEIVDYEDYH